MTNPDPAPSTGAEGQPGTQAAASASEEKEWWDDPGLPWHHKPERADLWCLAALSFVGIYGLVMLPLRPVMLSLAPHVMGSLGYRTGIIMTGALAAVGNPWWPLVLVVGSLMTIKFSWIYWWAGRRWGRDILDVMARDKSARTKRRYEKVWETTHRFETLALLVTFLPLPIPAGIVFAALGAAGTSLRKFLLVCLTGALVSTGAYMYAGYAIGEPAVHLMDVYGRYLWYFSIALLVGIIVVAVWRSRKAKAGA